jgi:predicted SnoaL-like aldol condensation-catalyzing enzyme
MQRISISLALLLVVFLSSGATATSKTSTDGGSTMTNSDSEQLVVELLQSIETGDPHAASIINPDKYIQHNLTVADGLTGFGALLQQLPKGSAKAKVIRVFSDGDFVFTHTDYDFFGPKVGFDIFRFEKGKIVEHWDNLQVNTNTPNPSGHTLFDGPTKPYDLDKTEANKTLVRAFLDDILINGKMEKLSGYFDGDNYIQHNPSIADGLSGLGAAMQSMAKAGIVMKYDQIHRVLGEGNFVLAISEGSFGNKRTAFYDLFRIENGKIAEHWDIIETILPEDQWKNTHGKF